MVLLVAWLACTVPGVVIILVFRDGFHAHRDLWPLLGGVVLLFTSVVLSGWLRLAQNSRLPSKHRPTEQS
jgi:chromate transport protein ChrA